VLIETVSAVLPWSYVQQVQDAGGVAVLIPPDPEGAVEVLDTVDGLVIAGGADVEPYRYGEEPHPKLGSVNPARDAGELPLARHALRYGVPLLGICRGMQIMAVATGGKLYQHIPDVVGSDLHRIPGPVKQYNMHAVKLETIVNSYHHQGVADPGKLVPTGWCTDDQLVESLEHPDHPFAVGVQWHPEDMDSSAPLFAALVTAAAQAKSARSALVTV
jgi:putative glutamine amidotransferase